MRFPSRPLTSFFGNAKASSVVKLLHPTSNCSKARQTYQVLLLVHISIKTPKHLSGCYTQRTNLSLAYNTYCASRFIKQSLRIQNARMNTTVREDEVALEAYLNGKPVSAAEVAEFEIVIKRRQYESSYTLAKQTLELLRNVVGRQRWHNAAKLMQVLRALGRRLIRACPLEMVVGNCVRRVLFQIREEYNEKVKELTILKNSGSPSIPDSILEDAEQRSTPTRSPSSRLTGSSQFSTPTSTAADLARSASTSSAIGERPALVNILTQQGASPSDDMSENMFEVQFGDLRSSVIDGVNELIAEVENIYDPIARQALDHIHANETVLVYGYSRSVEEFLLSAKRKREFEVVVAEAAPDYKGHEMAQRLATAGISTTVIVDNAIFALMARVNKVIIGTHAVMADGGLVALAGTHMVTLAAKQHSVPVVCVTGLYKLCPVYPHNHDSFNDLKSPGSVLDYSEIPTGADIQVISPAYDFVDSKLISLYITNTGGHQPSYIYRLLAEHYNQEDMLTEGCAMFS